MKILYLSCHSVLEFDEVSLLTELGHEVFSCGAYSNPLLGGDNRRGPIKGAKFHDTLFSTYMQCSKEKLHPDLVAWADVVISMHNSKIPLQKTEQPWITGNWPLLKNKRTIWRSIGQSIQLIEEELQFYKDQGLQIVRYSPKENTIPSYAGDDAIIRFYKDPDEYKDWNGKKEIVLNFSQSLKQRGDHCGYDVFMKATDGFNRKVYGPGNSDLGDLWGGVVDQDGQKKLYRDSRVYFYNGTAPASYTLSLIEAMMTGIPVVAAGPAFTQGLYNQDTNEIEDIIQNGVNGFVSNDTEELKKYIELMMNSKEDAKRIGDAGRITAKAMFGKDAIRQQWEGFLNNG